MSQRTGPLRDITILDCTMALAGPFGSAILADLGADVIKIEPPGGDISRGLPPHPKDFATPASERQAGCDFGGYFASINRNKRSITLDLKSDVDREIFFKMCEQADVVLENTRSGVMDRLGCGYERVAERNPAIVYGAVRGFGDPRTGESPYVDWPAFDIVAQCMGGLAHINGPDTGVGFPAGASVGDTYPGTLLALGVLAAVHEARRSGKGQFVDVAMYDAVSFLCESLFANYSYGGRVLGPRGSGHPNLCPFDIYPAADGGVAIAAPGPKHWEALCLAMARPDLVDDERTANLKARVNNREFVSEAIIAWTASRSKSAIVGVLGGKVPCGPVNTAEDLFADPHLEVRGMIKEVDVPGDNPPVKLAGSPIKFTRTRTDIYRRAPLLDEHRAEILAQFGIDE
ncbi:MAG: CoA transferase [Gammaproteobacteria bacterium]|nr:CoA transferase [Gammaproteobacteria bacterium]